MKNKLYDIIEGNDILTLNEAKANAIVEGIIYPNDYVILVAEEKVGKTLLAQQLACNLTTANAFLGIFDIVKKNKVWYIATEGKSEDLKDRFIRMNKIQPLDTSYLKLIPTFFRFNTEEGARSLTELVIRFKEDRPDVVIIDALYRAIKGSIKNDDVVNDFHFRVGWLMKQLDCAVFLVHHMTKPQRNQVDGSMFARSDKDTFGSAFLLAAVDHCFWLEKWKGKKEDGLDTKLDRVLKCDTQRSGNIMDDIRIRLIQPDPLYFEVVSIYEEGKHRVMELLKSTHSVGMHNVELVGRSNISRGKIYGILKELQKEGKVEKYGSKVKYYKIK